MWTWLVDIFLKPDSFKDTAAQFVLGLTAAGAVFSSLPMIDSLGDVTPRQWITILVAFAAGWGSSVTPPKP